MGRGWGGRYGQVVSQRQMISYVTRSAKIRHNCAFCVSRNTNFKYSRCCNYLMPQCMDARSTV